MLYAPLHMSVRRAQRTSIPAGQTANPRKTIKDIYKTVDRCAFNRLFRVIFQINSFCVMDTSFQTQCFALLIKLLY